MKYKVRDTSLAEQGMRQLDWAELHMPALLEVRKDLSKAKPLKGFNVTAMLHVTKETGVLVRTLKAAGARMALTAANPISTQDDIAAALAKEGFSVFAWRGQSPPEYYKNIESALSIRPNILIDDGADLHAFVHSKGLWHGVMGGTEETTTGVSRLKALEKNGALRYPIIAVNNAKTKYLFDNRYGTGQSTVDGILRATNILMAGKCVVVVGYGWVGRGIAMRMNGMGARVIVAEVNPFRALEAVMDGFEVMPIQRAAAAGDLFVTATGNRKAISSSSIMRMKNGAILANAGHFDVEIDVKWLQSRSRSKRRIREHMAEYTLSNGRRVYLLAEGRIVNLVAAEGHPSEVMDLSFCNQALSAVYIAENHNELERRVYDVSREIDEKVANLKLKSLGVETDRLTKEQRAYLSDWKLGT